MRNYFECFVSCAQKITGEFVSFISLVPEEMETFNRNFLQDNPGGQIFESGRAFFLLSRANVTEVLNLWTQDRTDAFHNHWVFFQDGLVAKKSPRKPEFRKFKLVRIKRRH